MEWIIIFAVSWVVFFILVDFKEFKLNSMCGVLAIFLQLSVDTNMMEHGLYKIHEPIIDILGSSVFFGLGPVFVIGTLIAQYHPEGRLLRLLNILVLTTLYTIQEVMLINAGVLEYTNWHVIDSILINVFAMTILSWFAIVVLNKKGYAAR